MDCLHSVKWDHLVVGEDRENEIVFLHLLTTEKSFKCPSLLNTKLLVEVSISLDINGVGVEEFGHTSHILVMSDANEELLNIVWEVQA